jgi:hypothetical protein
LLQLEYVLPRFVSLSELHLEVSTLSATLGVPKEVWKAIASITSLRKLTLQHTGSKHGSWNHHYSRFGVTALFRPLQYCFIRDLIINLALGSAAEHTMFQPEVHDNFLEDCELLPRLKRFETDCPWLFGQIYCECMALEDVVSSQWSQGSRKLTHQLHKQIIEALGDKKFLSTFDIYLPRYFDAYIELSHTASFLSNVKELVIHPPPVDKDEALPEIRYPVGYIPGLEPLVRQPQSTT